MRRTLAALSATAVLIPLAVTAAPGAASAATNTLTVNVYGRDGAKVKTHVWATNLGNRRTHTLTANKAHKLPKGKYAVGASITGKDDSETLGARIIKVSGASSTVIDGRKGKPFDVALNPPVAEPGAPIEARICAAGGLLAQTYARSGKLYVIPHTSENLQFAYAADWWDASAQMTKYATVGAMKGLPNNVRKTVQRSSLVPVTVTARTQSNGDQQYQGVSLQSRAGGCARDLVVTGFGDSGGLKGKLHVPAGKWRFHAETQFDFAVRDRTFVRGEQYSQSFFGAGRGPGYNLPFNSGSGLYFEAHGMFTDPGFRGVTTYGADGYNYGAGTKTAVTLTKGGTTLKKQTKTATLPHEQRFNYRLKSAGWYTLTAQAKRTHPSMAVPSGMLSNWTTAKFRFYADPKKSQVAPVYLTRFAPTGLNIRNQATAGSTTQVNVALERKSQGGVKLGAKPKVKTIQVWASYDNGKTWKKAALKKSGGKWIATVKNPKSGYVALRSKVTDTLGNYSDITIYRAYRIA